MEVAVCTWAGDGKLVATPGTGGYLRAHELRDMLHGSGVDLLSEAGWTCRLPGLLGDVLGQASCRLGLGGGMRFVLTRRAGGHSCPSSARIWVFSLGVVELNTGSSVALKLVILFHCQILLSCPATCRFGHDIHDDDCITSSAVDLYTTGLGR